MSLFARVRIPLDKSVYPKDLPGDQDSIFSTDVCLRCDDPKWSNLWLYSLKLLLSTRALFNRCLQYLANEVILTTVKTHDDAIQAILMNLVNTFGDHGKGGNMLRYHVLLQKKG